jgi:hypothetical protein
VSGLGAVGLAQRVGGWVGTCVREGVYVGGYFELVPPFSLGAGLGRREGGMVVLGVLQFGVSGCDWLLLGAVGKGRPEVMNGTAVEFGASGQLGIQHTDRLSITFIMPLVQSSRKQLDAASRRLPERPLHSSCRVCAFLKRSLAGSLLRGLILGGPVVRVNPKVLPPPPVSGVTLCVPGGSTCLIWQTGSLAR